MSDCCDQPVIGPGSLGGGGGGVDRTIFLTRTLPVAVNDFVNIGSFIDASALLNDNFVLDLQIVVSGSSFSAAARYMIATSADTVADTWLEVKPLCLDADPNGNIYSLELKKAALDETLYLRLRRLSGSTDAGQARVTIFYDGQTGFVADSGTGTDTGAAGEFGPAVITQRDNMLLVGAQSIINGEPLLVVVGDREAVPQDWDNAQIQIRGIADNQADRLVIGLNNSGPVYDPVGVFQAGKSGIGWYPIMLNPRGGRVSIGIPGGESLYGDQPTAVLDVGQSDSNRPSLRLRVGTEPATENKLEGVIWFDAVGLRAFVKSETITLADNNKALQVNKFESNVETTVITADDTPTDISANWDEQESSTVKIVLDTMLDYSSESGNFTLADTVTGSISGATGVITDIDDLGTTGTLTVELPSTIVNNFQAGELITGAISGSATLDKIYGEARYDGVNPATVRVSGSLELDPVTTGTSEWAVLVAVDGTVDRPGVPVQIGADAKASVAFDVIVPQISVVSTISLMVERTAGTGDIVVPSARWNIAEIKR